MARGDRRAPSYGCHVAVYWVHAWPPKASLTTHVTQVSKHFICHCRHCPDIAIGMCQNPRGLFLTEKKLMHIQMVWIEWSLARAFRDSIGALAQNQGMEALSSDPGPLTTSSTLGHANYQSFIKSPVEVTTFICNELHELSKRHGIISCLCGNPGDFILIRRFWLAAKCLIWLFFFPKEINYFFMMWFSFFLQHLLNI